MKNFLDLFRSWKSASPGRDATARGAGKSPLTRDSIMQNIAKTVSVFRSSPNLEDQEVYRVLVESGMERRCAARLVELLPTAYFCVMFAGSGLQLPQTSRRDPGDGRVSIERPLSSEPVWEPALAFARAEAQAGISQQDWLAVARRSAYLDAVNNALNKGATLESLKGASFLSISFWPEDGPDLPS